MIEKTASFKNTEIYTVPNDKFKQSVIVVKFTDITDRERLYKNNLIGKVLRRGTSLYPSTILLNRKLEELYGTVVRASASCEGNLSFVTFSAEIVDDRFLPNNEKIFRETAELLLDMIYSPYTENGGFSREYTEREKNNLKERVISQKNDKMGVCIDLAKKIAFSGDPRSLQLSDCLKDEKTTDEKTLYEYYRNYFLKKLPVRIYVSSSSDSEIIEEIIKEKKYYSEEECINPGLILPEYKEERTKRRTHREKNVSQGKLCMLFKNSSGTKSNYFPSVFLSDLLGGSEASVLFRTVREENSLSYSVLSMFSEMDDTVTVICGINEEERDKARQLILEAFDKMKKGMFSDEDMALAVEKRKNRINGMFDSQAGTIVYQEAGIVFGRKMTPEENLQAYAGVTREEIAEAASWFVLDTEVMVCGTKKQECENGKL